MNPKFIYFTQQYLEIANSLAAIANLPVNLIFVASTLLFICINIVVYKIIKFIFPPKGISAVEAIRSRSTSAPTPVSVTAPTPTPTPTPTVPMYKPATTVVKPPQTSNRSVVYRLNYEANTTMQNRYFNLELIYKQGSWRAYILNGMNYGSRSSDGHSTHRFYDNTLDLYYVCWSVPIQNLEQITKVAKMWADGTMRYIETGRF